MFRKIAIALFVAYSAIAFAGPVNVNKADEKTLAKELVGVGSKTAGAIVKEREKAQFKDEADFEKRVKGVGKKTMEKNKGNLKFSD